MDLITFLEYLAFVVTLLFFITGIEPVLGMLKTGETKDVPFEIFLLSIFSCSIMTHYAHMGGVTSIVLLNGIGTILNSLYVLAYLATVKDKGRPLQLLFGVLALEAAVYYYAFQIASEQEAGDILGLASSLMLTFVMCLPAFELVDNFKNKNANGIPAILLWAGNVSGVVWLAYGWLVGDPFIYAPNIPAIILNCLKLYAISLYGGKKKAE